MALDIEVKADVEGLRELASWIGKGAGSVHDLGTAVVGVRGNAESEWGGDSGRSFQGAMGRMVNGTDGVASDMDTGRQAVDVFADEMDTVKRRMQQAREVATEAGLTCNDKEIEDPGAGPAKPKALGDDPSPEEKEQHTSAQGAYEEHQKKVKAYKECEKTVQEAREKETAARRHLRQFGSTQAKSAPFTVASVAAGLATNAVEHTSKYSDLATKYGKHADDAAKAQGGYLAQQRAALKQATKGPVAKLADKLPAKAKDLLVRKNVPVLGSKISQTSAMRAQAVKYGRLADRAGNIAKDARTFQQAAKNKALSNPAVRGVDKLPTAAKAALAPHEFIKGGGGVARVGKAVLKRVPVVGTGITAIGIGADISQGKDATKAIASGVGGLAAGAAVGTMIGGPVGTVVGAAVGAGVSYAIDQWGDDAANIAKDVGSTVSDGAKKAGNFVKGLFD